MQTAVDAPFGKFKDHFGAFCKAPDGVIAIEFAFIAPVMLVLMLGVIEASLAISDKLTVQSAARAGTHFGLTKPPVQGNMAPIVAAVRAAMPADWATANNGGAPQINASLYCECQVTGPAACGAPCAAGEAQMTYLKVQVQKLYKPLLSFRNFAPSFTFNNTSTVRLK